MQVFAPSFSMISFCMCSVLHTCDLSINIIYISVNCHATFPDVLILYVNEFIKPRHSLSVKPAKSTVSGPTCTVD